MTNAAKHAGAEQRSRTPFADLWPEVLLVVPAQDRPLAERILIARLLTATDEDLAELIAADPDTFCFAIVNGAVLKETTLDDRTALELLGPGDLLVPPLSPARQTDAQAVSRYRAHGPVTLAAIDQTFRQASRRWPGLSDLLHDRLAQQTHRASSNLALLHLPRVEDRLLALFRDLANRYGTVHNNVVRVELPLTHYVLGQLVASRRSTVTLALRTLADQHQITRRPDGSWQLDLTLVTD